MITKRSNCKLTIEQVKEIKKLLKWKEKSNKEIAKMFQVNPTTISKIKNQNSWSEI